MDDNRKQNTTDKEDEQLFSYDYEQDQEKEGKRPIFIRILALFTFIAFTGFVFLTTCPGLTLPSLDFLFQSKKLSEEPSVNCLKQYVVQINVFFRSGKTIFAEKSGTGFNISSNGVIVTNRHVLSDAISITVTFPNGMTYSAKNYKKSPDMDLALIYLETEGLPAVTMNMEKMAGVGDKVIIIGNPLGIDNVVMEGTVSAYLRVSGCPAPVFVIDAPIQPGNSGSPVFDENMEVVGVVFGSTRQTGDTKKQQGVAVPAKEILELLK